MNREGWHPDAEDIIREALQHELESAPPSPQEPAWERIQAALARKTKKASAFPLLQNPAGRRLAAVAALILLFIGGGLTLGRLALPSFFSMTGSKLQRDSVEERADDEALAPESSQDPSQYCGFFPLAEEWDEELFQEKDHYPAAVYRNGDERLLWIYPSSADNLQEFMDELGRQLGVEIEPRRGCASNESVSGGAILEFKAGGRPGIAWLWEGGAQAVLVVSGDADLRELLSLWERGEIPFCPPE